MRRCRNRQPGRRCRDRMPGPEASTTGWAGAAGVSASISSSISETERPGLPGQRWSRTAGIAEAARPVSGSVRKQRGPPVRRAQLRGRRTQRHSVCGHLCSKISRRKDHRIALHTACHIQLRQLDRDRLGLVLHGNERRVKFGLLRDRRQRGLKLGRLRQVQRRLGTDLLWRIVRRVAADSAVDERIQLVLRRGDACAAGAGVTGVSGVLYTGAADSEAGCNCSSKILLRCGSRLGLGVAAVCCWPGWTADPYRTCRPGRC